MLLVVIFEIARYCKKNKAKCNACSCAPAKEEQPVLEPVVVEEVKTEPKAEPIVKEVVEEPVVEVVSPMEEELVIGDIDDELSAKRIPFKDKILSAEEIVKGFYVTIDNAFRSYRKVNPRVSIKGVSYRLGRDLVAKLTIRGKTLKLHLALGVADFDQKVYFQKDMSDVKEYVEVPITVKVRSERALKNALKLIDALAEKHSIEKKTRFTAVDSIAILSEKE